MRYEVNNGDTTILLLDSISEIVPEDEHKIVVAGSHASQNVPRYALSIPLRGAVFNDAGIGKDQAGIASLPTLNAGGLPAATVSHESARIGDARDVYENGIISTVNKLASDLGASPGMPASEFVELLARTN
jgi:hypothetical protein